MHIVADIGGTKMRVAGTRNLGRFSEPVILDTPTSYSDMIALLTRVAENIAGNEPLDAIAIGIIGVLSEDRRELLHAPAHRARWSDRQLADDIESALDTVAVLENDTALVGLGEALFGAGRGASIVGYMTVSTGVNGARIVDGRVDRTHRGFEIGGQIIDRENTLEELVSGSAIEQRFGVPPKALGPDNPVWDELARTLAYGLHNTILHWSPDVFVLGGSMFNEIGISVASAQEYTATLMEKFPDIPAIVHAELGDVGGLWGGIALLRSLTTRA